MRIQAATEGGHRILEFDGSKPFRREFWEELESEVHKAHSHPLRSLTLYGGPEVFGIGSDLSWLTLELRRRERAGDPRALITTGEDMRRVIDMIRDLPMPSFAVCAGDTIGSAAELACAVDFRICLKAARVSLPESQLGMLPDFTDLDVIVSRLGANAARKALIGGQALEYNAEQLSDFFEFYAETPEEAKLLTSGITSRCAHGDLLVQLRTKIGKCLHNDSRTSAWINHRMTSVNNVVQACHTWASTGCVEYSRNE